MLPETARHDYSNIVGILLPRVLLRLLIPPPPPPPTTTTTTTTATTTTTTTTTTNNKTNNKTNDNINHNHDHHNDDDNDNDDLDDNDADKDDNLTSMNTTAAKQGMPWLSRPRSCENYSEPASSAQAPLDLERLIQQNCLNARSMR